MGRGKRIEKRKEKKEKRGGKKCTIKHKFAEVDGRKKGLIRVEVKEGLFERKRNDCNWRRKKRETKKRGKEKRNQGLTVKPAETSGMLKQGIRAGSYSGSRVKGKGGLGKKGGPMSR